ncbi:MAG: hypothetical protein UC390_06685 [Peptococcaceae bacterium]|nr:hypothetical protein [Peptococcaceae bacterium]
MRDPVMTLLGATPGTIDWWDLFIAVTSGLICFLFVWPRMFRCRKASATKKEVRKALALCVAAVLWCSVIVVVLSDLFVWSLVKTMVVLFIGTSILWFFGRHSVDKVVDKEKMKEWPLD